MYIKDQYQKHIANVIGHDGHYVKVKSVHPDSDFLPHMPMWGYQQEWRVNHSQWIKSPPHIMAGFNLSYEEWNELDKKFTKRYDPKKESWYEVEPIKEN